MNKNRSRNNNDKQLMQKIANMKSRIEQEERRVRDADKEKRQQAVDSHQNALQRDAEHEEMSKTWEKHVKRTLKEEKEKEERKISIKVACLGC